MPVAGGNLGAAQTLFRRGTQRHPVHYRPDSVTTRRPMRTGGPPDGGTWPSVRWRRLPGGRKPCAPGALCRLGPMLRNRYARAATSIFGSLRNVCVEGLLVYSCRVEPLQRDTSTVGSNSPLIGLDHQWGSWGRLHKRPALRAIPSQHSCRNITHEARARAAGNTRRRRFPDWRADPHGEVSSQDDTLQAGRHDRNRRGRDRIPGKRAAPSSTSRS